MVSIYNNKMIGPIKRTLTLQFLDINLSYIKNRHKAVLLVLISCIRIPLDSTFLFIHILLLSLRHVFTTTLPCIYNAITFTKFIKTHSSIYFVLCASKMQTKVFESGLKRAAPSITQDQSISFHCCYYYTFL